MPSEEAHTGGFSAIATRDRNRHNIYCCQCRIAPDRPLRCARCKVCQYCSSDCQRNHYRLHKMGCLLVDKAQNESSVMKEDDKSWHLGDLVFQIAYRSCDTPERGAYMYEIALDHYCNQLNSETGPNDTDIQSSRRDFVRFLLVSLGHYDEFCKTFSSISMWDSDLHLQMFSQAQQFICCLLKLHLIALLRDNSQNWEDFITTRLGGAINASLTTEQLSNPQDCLQAQEQDLLTQIQNDVSQTLLDRVFDRGVILSQEIVPELFPKVNLPREAFCYVQDCFFLNASVSQVLNDLFGDLF